MEFGNVQSAIRNLQGTVIVFNKIKWQLTSVSNAEKKLQTKTLKRDFSALFAEAKSFSSQGQK